MLCPSCRRQLDRGAGFCLGCGAPVAGHAAPLELVLGDRTRVAVMAEMTIGRSPGSTLVIDDPTVSRVHARISGNGGGPTVIEDAGSSHGTWVNGARISKPIELRDGIRLRLGDQELLVERRRESTEPGRTIVVRPGASLVVPAMGTPGVTSQATQFGMRPRVRSGYALKRLEAAEGNRRWVLRDLESDVFLRLSDNDAQLFELFDGTRSLVDLIGEAEQRFGAMGPARLARLLADLGERGFLAGVAKATPAGGQEAPQSLLKRLFTPRSKVFPRLGSAFERLYRLGGWVLFTKPALIAIGVLMVVGLGVFAYLIGGRYGTPFVVADKFGLGGLVFLSGRFIVVVIHESAHGLAMASFGRKVQRAGLKLLFIFPYAFVDTSEAWFEPRRRRIAISAAGPVSDFSIGAVFALCCLALPRGHGPRHLLQPRVRRLRGRVLQPQPVHRPRRLPDPRRRAAGAGPAAAREGAVLAAPVRAAQRRDRFAGADALRRVRAPVVGRVRGDCESGSPGATSRSSTTSRPATWCGRC